MANSGLKGGLNDRNIANKDSIFKQKYHIYKEKLNSLKEKRFNEELARIKRKRR